MLVVAVVMILVVGPKDLPGMLRTIGKSVGNLRRMAGDFQRQFSDALKEAEFDEVKKDLAQVTSIPNPLDDINKSAEEMMGSIGADVDEAITTDILEDKPVGTVAKKPVKAQTRKKTPAKRTAAKTSTAKAKQSRPTAKRVRTKRKTATGSKTA